ncbi:MAG: tyrosine-type recombinase/integrase [Oscillospiraceae bacterium]|nr:tyrosine-type recombinase/integrase [Oscillospiraceae bacterium]
MLPGFWTTFYLWRSASSISCGLEKAGLPSIRFRDLRHTTATFMLQNAVPAKIVSAMLGHSSIGITMDTYSHVLTDMQEGATSKMNTLLKKLY